MSNLPTYSQINWKDTRTRSKNIKNAKQINKAVCIDKPRPNRSFAKGSAQKIQLYLPLWSPVLRENKQPFVFYIFHLSALSHMKLGCLTSHVIHHHGLVVLISATVTILKVCCIRCIKWCIILLSSSQMGFTVIPYICRYTVAQSVCVYRLSVIIVIIVQHTYKK